MMPIKSPIMTQIRAVGQTQGTTGHAVVVSSVVEESVAEESVAKVIVLLVVMVTAGH